MTKQYFSTSLKRVSVSLLFEMIMVLLIVACSIPSPKGEISKKSDILPASLPIGGKADNTNHVRQKNQSDYGEINSKEDIADKSTPLTLQKIKSPIVSMVLNKNQLKVHVSPVAGLKTVKTSGTSSDSSIVEYLFYYVKSDYREQINGNTIAVGAGITAETIMSLDYSRYIANSRRGKVLLTHGNGVGTSTSADKIIASLLGSTKYYYFVRVQEINSKNNGINSDVRSITTHTGATASGAPTNPIFSRANKNSFKLRWTAPIAPNLGKLGDGTDATNAKHIHYVIYYASGTDASNFNSAEKIKNAALFPSPNGANAAGVTQTAGPIKHVIVTKSYGKVFVGAIYAVVEAVNMQDSTKISSLSTIAKGIIR